jgi:hypothetical protein
MMTTIDNSAEQNDERADDRNLRADRVRLHVVRHSVLSRSLLEGLVRHGENIRTLRGIEKELRSALKPTGAIGRLFFDRFWSSVLRLILVARLEGEGIVPRGSASKNSPLIPSLHEGAVPTLIVPVEPGDLTGNNKSPELLDTDVFQRLALASRYDRGAGREMYRTLALLLLMRDRGEAGLENWVRATIGVRHEDGEGKSA